MESRTDLALISVQTAYRPVPRARRPYLRSQAVVKYIKVRLVGMESWKSAESENIIITSDISK